MIRIVASAAAAALVLATAPAAWAQDALPDSENGRYSFNQVGDELLRLDARTGQVSLCSKRDVGWSCLTVPDERSALEAEIGRLQSQNVALKRELISRGIALPDGTRAPETLAPSPGEPSARLPTDEDLDRMSAFMEKLWRRLVDMVQTMQKETEKKAE